MSVIDINDVVIGERVLIYAPYRVPMEIYIVTAIYKASCEIGVRLEGTTSQEGARVYCDFGDVIKLEYFDKDLNILNEL